MSQGLVQLAKRSRVAVIAKHLVFSRAALRGQIGEHGQSAGATPAEAADYAEGVFEAVLGHAGLGTADLEGARVLELGPGDNLGLALRFVAAGAEQVVTLDRFAVPRDRELERRIYDELLARLPEPQRGRGDAAFANGRIRSLSGVGVEDAPRELEPESFDLIVSVAVLEHVQDTDASFAAMDALLKPGGLMLHQVDLRDHGMFSSGGQHPLTFLTIPDALWRAMTARWGGPNRRLIDYYRGKLEELGYRGDLVVDERHGPELVEEIRPRLRPPFRDLPGEDLAPMGLFMVARKC